MKKHIVGIVAGVFSIAILAVGGLFLLNRKEPEVNVKNILEVSWYDQETQEFVITTAEQLEELADLSDFYNFKGQTIKLGADIVVNEGNAEDWAKNPPAKRWEPISGFSGTFDGQGHTISGVYGNGFDRGMALFTDTKRECQIKDVKLVNSYFNTSGEGGTASFSSNGSGKFIRLYSDAIIKCNGENIGGIVAIIDAQSTVEECWYAGTINTTNRDCGGIVGEIIGTRASVKHCLFTGTITSTYTYGGTRTGGLIGHADGTTTLTFGDCLSVGRINAEKMVYTGSAIGATYSGGTYNISDVYVSEETYGGPLGLSSNGTFVGTVVKWQERRLTGTSAYEWTTLDFKDYWSLVKDGTPVLKCFAEETVSTDGLAKKFDTSWYNAGQTTYVLDSVEDFYGFLMVSLSDTFVGKTVTLGADIVLNEGKAAEWSEKIPENEWRPVGDRFTQFRGTFDGQGHTISGIYIVERDGNQVYTGLFGVTGQEAVIKNLRLTNSYFERTNQYQNNNFVGSIVGDVRGKVETVYSDAIIVSDGKQVGGLFGRLNSVKVGSDHVASSVNNCWFDGRIIMLGEEGRFAGGIVGTIVQGTVSISNCLFTGHISAEASAGLNIGGIVGLELANEGIVVNISDCLAAGTIEHKNCYTRVGTFIGGMNAKTSSYVLERCYTVKGVCVDGKNNDLPYGLPASAKRDGYIISQDAKLLTGMNGYRFTELDFKNYWSVNEKGVPVLKSFASSSPSVAGVTRMMDTSWYNPDAKVLTLDSVADFYGFAELSKHTNFEGQTIKLATDIVFNTGDASTWGEKAPEYSWIPVGNKSTFKGNFDGQGHTISGLYVKDTSETTTYTGMFGIVGTGCTIKNFRLVNSYFERTGHKDNYGFVASVAGDMRGTVDTVYSNAIVKTDGIQSGGIVARANGVADKDKKPTTVKINNCWFDGQLIVEGTKGRYAGGIAGATIQGIADITNCLFTGNISVEKEDEGLNVGGVLGIDWGICKVNISNCFSAGQIDVVRHVGVGSVIGRFRYAKTQCTIDNTYATKQSYNLAVGSPTSSVPKGNVFVMDEAMFTGIKGYQNTTLDFAKYWVAVAEKTPELKSFSKNALSTADVEKLFDISWYSADATELEIDSIADLYGFYQLSLTENFKEKTIKLTKDIDLNEGWTASSVAPSNVWKSIGTDSLPFAGTFDGQGHTIKGLYLKEERTSTQYSGFFGVTATGSTIRNLKITNSYFERTADKNGYAFIGSIAGEARGIVDTVYSDAIVVTNGKQAGGLVGRLNGAKVEGNTTTATINNSWYAGEIRLSNDTGTHAAGIVGVAVQGELNITNCLFTGSISSNHTSAVNVGGILGIHWTQGTTINMKDCISAGEVTVQNVTDKSMVGSVLGGTAHGSTYKFERVYGTSKTLGSLHKDTVINGEASVRTDLTGYTGYMYTELDFVNTWAARDGKAPALQSFYSGETLDVANALRVDVSWYNKSSADGTVENPYVIDSVNDFYGFAYLVNEGIEFFAGKTVVLGADIDIAKYNNNWKVNGKNTTAPFYTWSPIGGNNLMFAGTFDGQGHTISGVYVKDTNAANTFVGLFGMTATGSIIKNLRLTNSYFERVNNTSGYAFVGSVAGEARGTIDTVFSDAIIVTDGKQAGGIVGRVNAAKVNNVFTNAYVKNCWYDGDMFLSTGNGTHAGGIAGVTVQGNIYIENCLYTGSITSSHTSAVNAGGILGTHWTANNVIYLSDCLSVGILNINNVAANSLVGSIVGGTVQGSTYNFERVYGSKETANVAVGNCHKDTVVNGTAISIPIDNLKGKNAYQNTNLDFYSNANTDGVWAAIEGKTPELKVFTKEAVISDFSGIAKVSTDWYYGATSNTTTYEIRTIQDLYGLRELVNNGVDTFEGKTIVLKQDIPVNTDTGTALDWAAGKNVAGLVSWTPIGTKDNVFKGTFDGANNTISGIYALRGQYTGVFGAVSGATIKNLRIEDSYFGSNMGDAWNFAYFGSVVGQGNGTLKNIYSNAIVKTRQAYTGGLVGYATGDLTMDSCWFDGIVYSAEVGNALESGGFIGRIESGKTSINACLYTGDFFGEYTSTLNTQTTYGATVGALAGRVATNASIQVTNSLVAGTVDVKWISTAASAPAGITYVGPIAGRINTAANGVSSNTYVTTAITTKVLLNNVVNVAAAGVGTNAGADLVVDTTYHKKEAELYGENGKTLLAGLDFVKNADESVWTTRKDALPAPASLVSDGNFTDTSWYTKGGTSNVIDSAADLRGFAMLSAGGETFAGDTITLGKDITLNTGDAKKWANNQETENLIAWTPIGRSAAFAGTFDGQGHTISGVYINITDTAERVGFFGYVATTGVVKNFRLTNTYVYYSYWELGSVVGDLHGNLENVYSDAIVYGQGGNRIGGLVGRMHNTSTASIKNCWFDGTVTGTVKSIGGIVGSLQNGAKTVENCLNTGKVISTRTSKEPAVGGIVGNVEGVTSGKTHQIKNCVNTGEVIASGIDRIGAIIGYGNKAISLSSVYTTNKITLNGSASLGTVTVTGIGSGTTGVTGAPAIISLSTDIQATLNALNASGNNWQIKNGQLVLTTFQDLVK